MEGKSHDYHALWNSLIEQLGLPQKQTYLRLEFKFDSPPVAHIGVVLIDENKKINIQHLKAEVSVTKVESLDE